MSVKVIAKTNAMQVKLWNRHFSKLRKIASRQLAECCRHINCNSQGPKTEFSMGIEDTINFYIKHKPFALIKTCKINIYSFGVFILFIRGFHFSKS